MHFPNYSSKKLLGLFKPQIKHGKGFLMLFIVVSKHYYLDSSKNDDLKIAHIVISVEGTTKLNAPLTIGPKSKRSIPYYGNIISR